MTPNISIKEKINILQERISNLDTEMEFKYALKAFLESELDTYQANLFIGKENMFKNTKWLLNHDRIILTYIDNKNNLFFETFKSLNLNDYDRVNLSTDQDLITLQLNQDNELVLSFPNLKCLVDFTTKYDIIIDKSSLDEEIALKKLELDSLKSLLKVVTK